MTDDVKLFVIQALRPPIYGESVYVMSDRLREAAKIIESLSAQLEQVTRERDAAVRDIRNAALCGCHVCKHYYRPDQNVREYACKIHGSFDEHDFIADDGSIFCGAMEWRGVVANQ